MKLFNGRVEWKDGYDLIVNPKVLVVLNEKRQPIYYENIKGQWEIMKYDVKGNVDYFENSNGEIIDSRKGNRVSYDELQSIVEKLERVMMFMDEYDLEDMEVDKEIERDVSHIALGHNCIMKLKDIEDYADREYAKREEEEELKEKREEQLRKEWEKELAIMNKLYENK